MKKFLLLYRSTIPATEQMRHATPEQAKAGMAAWMSWAQQAGSAIVDLGNPVTNVVTLDAPGTPAPANSQVAGFSILQAESKDALTALLAGHPHFMAPGASIEVLEFLPLPGM